MDESIVNSYENWVSEFIEIPVEHLQKARYINSEGDYRYIGLHVMGYSPESDLMAFWGLYVWAAAHGVEID